MTKEKTREPHFPGDGLSKLQQEALRFIHHCQEKLAALQIYIRSSEMLEFVTTNNKNEAAHDAIDISGFTVALQKQLPRYFNKRGQNSAVHAPQSSVQYELTIADPADVHQLANPIFYNPEAVAVGMNHARAVSIKNALMQTSSLNKPYKDIMANFHPLPFDKTHYDWAKQITSALQVKFNPVDGKGNNLFSKSPALRDACAESLLHMQDKAGLAFLPFEESLSRIGINLGTPGKLGITQAQEDDLPETRNVSTLIRIHKRGGRHNEEARFRNATHLENRLAGADADPLVVMALTLAACMKPLRAYAGQKLNRKSDKLPADIKIPETHSKLVEKFEDAHELEKILGKHFYHAILKEYGKEVSR